MSDFFSVGWSIYIAAATILGLVGCLALLVIASKTKQLAGDNSTGHVWDEDLRELNNPCRAGGWCCSSSRSCSVRST